jgi:peptidoglycan/xylan/chitin deacetylase (PgdA/CDA1 family)
MWEVSPAQLDRQLKTLIAHGYPFGTLHDLASDEDVVVVSFDDAYRNTFELALPVLAQLGLTATVFVPVSWVGGMNSFDRLSRLGIGRSERIMSWSDLRELAAAGWSIQSHGCSHLSMTSLLPDQIADELERSKREIEDRVGTAVCGFAYAFGALPRDEDMPGFEHAFDTCGYQFAVAATGGAVDLPVTDRYRIPRVLVTEEGFLDVTLRDAPVRNSS